MKKVDFRKLITKRKKEVKNAEKVTVTIAGEEVTLKVRKLSVEEMLEITGPKEEGDKHSVYARLTVMSVVDEDDKQIFTEKDLDFLANERAIVVICGSASALINGLELVSADEKKPN